jgi:PAP2 superfamily
MVSISLIDGFISCWDEKYRSKLIRPESYINQYIDENWLPILQTPPFPEYTSGHSVISGAASVALTHLFGENFSFTDSTEVVFGLPVRKFESFYQASSEAAISRMYGGIHYRPAVEEGLNEGKLLGSFVLSKIQTKQSAISEK